MSINKKASAVGHSTDKDASTVGSSERVSAAGDPIFPSKADSPQLFDAIAQRYDLLNYILSFGMDIGWRKKLGRFLPAGNNLNILDLATGTADVAIALAKHNRGVRKVVGVDLADEMLRLGRAKVERLKLADRIRLEKADALALPFPKSVFDAVTVAFGLRNMPDVMKALIEIHRVLGPGGRLIVLEFSRPANIFIRLLHSFYLLWVVPAIGYALTGNAQAYRYLSRTVRDFPYGERFQRMMKQAGFVDGRRFELALGAATIYLAERPPFRTDGETI